MASGIYVDTGRSAYEFNCNSIEEEEGVFPYLKKDYIIRKVDIDGKKKIALYNIYDNKRSVEINEDALAVITCFTGESSKEEIANKIVSNYKISYDEALSKLNNLLQTLEEKEIIGLAEQKDSKYCFPKLQSTKGLLNHVYILLTNRCNLKCLHCSVDGGQKLRHELKKEEWVDLINQIYEMMVPGVTFTGGEPTLLEYLPELVQYTSSKPIKTHLMTNGYNIDETYAELLVKSGLVHVNVSLDGAQDGTHDAFRCINGSYRKAIEAIKIFKSLNIYVETTTVINQFNCDEIKEIIKIGDNLKVDNMKFVPIIPYGRGNNCDFKFSMDQYIKNLDEILPLYDRYGNIYNKLIKKDLIQQLAEGKEAPLRCGAGTGIIGIAPDGNVHPCNNLNMITMGNIKEKKLIDIYNNTNKLCEMIEIMSIKGAECEYCPLLDYCHGGCPMISYCYNGDFKRCDPTRKGLVLKMMQEGDGCN